MTLGEKRYLFFDETFFFFSGEKKTVLSSFTRSALNLFSTLLLMASFQTFYGALSPRGGGVLPSNRLMRMCRWMGRHFHDWIDYNGVAFSVELLEWDRTFSGFWGVRIFR